MTEGQALSTGLIHRETKKMATQVGQDVTADLGLFKLLAKHAVLLLL